MHMYTIVVYLWAVCINDSVVDGIGPFQTVVGFNAKENQMELIVVL